MNGRGKTYFFTAVILYLWFGLLDLLVTALGASEQASFFIGLPIVFWLAVGYQRVFGHIPTVDTFLQALRAFVLALCWPAFQNKK